MSLRWRLYHQSRNPRTLAIAALLIMMVGATLGSVLRWTGISGQTDNLALTEYILAIDSAGSMESFGKALDENKGQLYKLIPLVHTMSGFEGLDVKAFENTVREHVPDEVHQRILIALLLSKKSKAHEVALQNLADAEPPIPFASYAMAVLLEDFDKEQAFQYLKREAIFPEAESARRSVIRIAIYERKLDEVERIVSDPIYAKDLRDKDRYGIATIKSDWVTALRYFFVANYGEIPYSIFALAFVAGLMWFIFLLQSAQPSGEGKMKIILLCCGGIVLGILSIPPTVLFISFEHNMGFMERTDLFGGLVYFILGVGLREEFFKILLFLPLLPFLKKGEDKLALVVAACVGLGFAAEENLSYFHSSGELNAVARFLTANFFHMALTGLIGLSLFRAIRMRNAWADFLNTFAIAVALHGIYDALIVLPELMPFSWFSSGVFILICYQYFHEYRAMRTPGRETVSLTATFLIGVATVFSATLVHLCAAIPVGSALLVLAATGLDYAILIYMFLRELPESLIR